MGHNSTWVKQSFFDNKKIVMERFGIQSGKFSDAIDAIKASGPLAVFIGKEADLKFITDEKALSFFRLWVVNNPRMTQQEFHGLGTDYFQRDRDKHREAIKNANKLDEAILQLLNLEEFSDLETIYYLGRNGEFGERYGRLLENTLSGNEKSRLRGKIHFISTKTNLLDCFAKGCESIGRPSLANKIRELSPEVNYQQSINDLSPFSHGDGR